MFFFYFWQKSYQKNYSNKENHLRLAAIEVKFNSDNESKALPTGKEEDDLQREEEFDAKDLLSFAWQIARGMVGCLGTANFQYLKCDWNLVVFSRIPQPFHVLLVVTK